MFQSLRQFFARRAPMPPAPPAPVGEKSGVIYADQRVGREHFIILRGAEFHHLIVRSTRDFVGNKRFLAITDPPCHANHQTTIIKSLWQIPGVDQMLVSSDELRIKVGLLHDSNAVAAEVETTLIAWLKPNPESERD